MGQTKIPAVMVQAGFTGMVSYFCANAAPAGWLKANGAAVSRTAYADLWAFAQASGMMASDATDKTNNPGKFYVGDGSTTFTLPDLRGEFLRGWDDSRGIDSGRAIGSHQADELKSHNHGYGDAAAAAGGIGTLSRSGGSNPSSYTGGAETRPRNAALLACIKF